MPKRRNTKVIGFNEEEYELIKVNAKELGLYPRQYVMLKVRGKS